MVEEILSAAGVLAWNSPGAALALLEEVLRKPAVLTKGQRDLTGCILRAIKHPEIRSEATPEYVRRRVSDEYLAFFKDTRANIIGRNLHERIGLTDRAAFMARFSALCPASPIVAHRVRVLVPDGSTTRLTWMDWLTCGVFDAGDNMLGSRNIGMANFSPQRRQVRPVVFPVACSQCRSNSRFCQTCSQLPGRDEAIA